MKVNEYKTKTGKPIRLWQGDCMELMEGKPENHWDLSIVDPPYGIDAGKNESYTYATFTKYESKDWDHDTPNDKYFKNLLDISCNQIIWGGNYFADMLPVSNKWIVWDKMIPKNLSFSNHELAWTSFNSAMNTMYKQSSSYANGGDSKNTANRREDRKRLGRIHPTQKPVKLYRWLLQNYATEGDTILDTHGGSFSLAIACYIEDFELDIIELDEDYYSDAVKRFENHISQKTLF